MMNNQKKQERRKRPRPHLTRGDFSREVHHIAPRINSQPGGFLRPHQQRTDQRRLQHYPTHLQLGAQIGVHLHWPMTIPLGFFGVHQTTFPGVLRFTPNPNQAKLLARCNQHITPTSHDPQKTAAMAITTSTLPVMASNNVTTHKWHTAVKSAP
jgi:hypothetical protein